VVGRVKTYEAIVKGQNVPKPGVPESFKVLIKELQSLGLDMKVLNQNNEEIDLKDSFDDEDDIGLGHIDDSAFSDVALDSDFDEGFEIAEPGSEGEPEVEAEAEAEINFQDTEEFADEPDSMDDSLDLNE
jgi:DNA-directed RNA polymerase subunit beta